MDVPINTARISDHNSGGMHIELRDSNPRKMYTKREESFVVGRRAVVTLAPHELEHEPPMIT